MSGADQTQSDQNSEEMRLVARARSGDVAAMGALLESYRQRVFGLCTRMLGQREDAADLTQDILTKFLTALNGFDGRSSLSTWVYRLTVNTVISHLRRRRTARAAGSRSGLDGREPEGEGPWSDSLPAREPAGEESVQTTEQRVMLLRALDELGDEARALLVLRDGRDLDYETIAEVLGLPLGTVKSRLFRARLALRKAMQTMERPAARSTNP